MSLKGRTLFITGGSRGIGEAIAVRAAEEGANVVIAAKTGAPHAKLEGTIHTTAEKIEAAGGRALAIQLDVRDDVAVEQAMKQAAEHFGGIDVLVNNASAIQLTGTLATEMKRFDLMFGVNVRGTYAASRAALPYLLRSQNPHILNLSPPLNMQPHWFGNHVAYTMSKYGMSMCVLGMAEEFRGKVAVNALWPRTTIATAAVNMLGGDAMMRASRKPSIMADAAVAILTRPIETTGRFFVDEDVLREFNGITNFDDYATTPGVEPIPDFFL